MRTMNARFGILIFAVPGMLAAQAMAETALGVGRAAASTAPAAQKTAKAVDGAFKSLSRTLEPAETKSGAARPGAAKPAGRTARTVPSRPQKAATAQPQPSLPESKAEVSFEDPSGIEKGMEYAEIVRRFGPPSLKLTTGPGEETLCYSKNNASVDVTMHNGKVASVQKAGG